MKKKDPTSHRIIEKRRRDRMNNCLADLSRLIPSHYMRKGRGRVEKTEIIEMAIRHLKDLRESLPGFQMDTHCELDSSTSPGLTREEDLSSYAQQTVTTTTSTTTSRGESQQHVHPSPVTSCAMPLDFTNQMKGLQQAAAISANHASHMTDSHGAHNMATTHHQQPMLQNNNLNLNNNNNHHHFHHHHQSLTAAASSASLSMKAFQHQQYHNNERQINNRASEQNNKYRSECCSCRARMSARLNDSAINETSINHNNHNNISSISNNSNQNNNSSSSDQSDTGSMDYPSSSSGSNKTQTVNKSTSESSSSGEGSPTSSLSSSSSHSSSSSSSSSTGWYKKAWLIRSFSRSVSKN